MAFQSVPKIISKNEIVFFFVNCRKDADTHGHASTVLLYLEMIRKYLCMETPTYQNAHTLLLLLLFCECNNL